MRPAQHDHGLDLPVLAGAGWLWVPLLGGAVTVVAATMLRTMVPAQIRPVDPVIGGVALGTALLVLVLAPGTALPRPIVGVLVLAMVTATRALAAPGGAGWLWPLRLLAPPLVLTALAGSVAVLVAAGTGMTGDRSPAVTTGLFVGIAGLVWLPLWQARSRTVAALRGVSSWVLAHAVLGATTVAALSAPQA